MRTPHHVLSGERVRYLRDLEAHMGGAALAIESARQALAAGEYSQVARALDYAFVLLGANLAETQAKVRRVQKAALPAAIDPAATLHAAVREFLAACRPSGGLQ